MIRICRFIGFDSKKLCNLCSNLCSSCKNIPSMKETCYNLLIRKKLFRRRAYGRKRIYENPRIPRYPNTGFQKALNLFSILVLILAFLYPLLKWNQIPDTIITHWGFSGQPDGWGPKGTIWIIPIVSLVLYLPLTILERFPLCLERACQNYPEKSKVGLPKRKNNADPYEISHDSRICRHYIPQCPGKKSEYSAYSPVSGLTFRLHDLFHYKKRPKTPGKLPLRNPSVLFIIKVQIAAYYGRFCGAKRP